MPRGAGIVRGECRIKRAFTRTSLVVEVVIIARLAVRGSMTIIWATLIKLTIWPFVMGFYTESPPVAVSILFVVSEAEGSWVLMVTTRCRSHGIGFLFNKNLQHMKRLIIDIPRRRSNVRFRTAPNHVRKRKWLMQRWRGIIESNAMGCLTVVQGWVKLARIMRFVHSSTERIVMINFKPDLLLSWHTTKNLTFTVEQTFKHRLWIGSVQKVMSANSLVSKDSYSHMLQLKPVCV